jgi:uncharacterized membrane protein
MPAPDNNGRDLFPEEDKSSFEAAFRWWEKRRLRYNIIVGCVGALLILLHGINHLDFWSILLIVIVGITANLFYCLGYISEFFLRYYFHSTTDFSDRRNSIYWIGTLFSVVALLIAGFVADVTK